MRPMIAGLVCFEMVAACSGGNARTGGDGGFQGTGPMCDPAGTFDAPVPVPGLLSTQPVGHPSLTADELEMYYTGSYRVPGHLDPLFSVRVVKRSTTSDAFGAEVELPLNTPTNDNYSPSISQDGMVLITESPSFGTTHLYISTRVSRSDNFSIPVYIPNVNSVNSQETDNNPFLTADDSELWFSSTRAGGRGFADIYRATGTSLHFGAATNIEAINSDNDELNPVVSADSLTVYFGSNRPGGKGRYDIWMASRGSTSDAFADVRPVSELNTAGNESPGWLSPDNCRLYFGSNASANTGGVLVATRHPH